MKEIRKFSKDSLTEEQLKKKEKIGYYFRIIACVVFIMAMVGITYLLYPIFQGVGKDGWLDDVQNRISEYSGISGLIIFLAIQAMQVLVAVIPAIQVVGGVLYGWFWGTVVSYTGIIIGSLAVWGIVKKLGAPLVQAIVSEKHMKKFGFLEDSRKLLVILIILYLIPGIPKDVLTYLVPLTKIKLRDFFLYVMPWRLPAIFLSAAVGSNATNGNYTAAIVFICLAAVIAVFGLIFKDRIVAFLSKHRKSVKFHK